MGLVATRGDAVHELRPGDVVHVEPGKEHWQFASADRFMAHVASQEADGHEAVVTGLQHLTDEEYAAVPAVRW